MNYGEALPFYIVCYATFLILKTMELKAIVVIIMIALIIYNAITYKPVYSETFGIGAPSLNSVVLFFITMALFIYGLYLNEFPIYLN